MRKIIISLAGAAVFLCGCNKPNTDNAKFDDLSRKLEIAINNETVLAADMAAIKSQTTNLPTLDEINRVDYFYHTNTIAEMGSCLKATADLISIQGKSIVDDVNAATARMWVFNFTNKFGGTGVMLDQLQEISLRTSAIEFSITNWPPVSTSDKSLKEMESEVDATKYEIHEMDHDLIKIKVQLGIPN